MHLETRYARSLLSCLRSSSSFLRRQESTVPLVIPVNNKMDSGSPLRSARNDGTSAIPALPRIPVKAGTCPHPLRQRFETMHPLQAPRQQLSPFPPISLIQRYILRFEGEFPLSRPDP